MTLGVTDLSRDWRGSQTRIIGDVLGRRIKFEELSPDEFRSETEGSWPKVPCLNSTRSGNTCGQGTVVL